MSSAVNLPAPSAAPAASQDETVEAQFYPQHGRFSEMEMFIPSAKAIVNKRGGVLYSTTAKTAKRKPVGSDVVEELYVQPIRISKVVANLFREIVELDQQMDKLREQCASQASHELREKISPLQMERITKAKEAWKAVERFWKSKESVGKK